jgi:hypothetical protein
MFNHQARWDRELPSDHDDLGPAIRATCEIEKGGIRPVSFLWRNRSFTVQRINFRWKDEKGREELWFFSVTTPHGTYELAFASRRLSWHLIRLIGP